MLQLQHLVLRVHGMQAGREGLRRCRATHTVPPCLRANRKGAGSLRDLAPRPETFAGVRVCTHLHACALARWHVHKWGQQVCESADRVGKRHCGVSGCEGGGSVWACAQGLLLEMRGGGLLVPREQAAPVRTCRPTHPHSHMRAHTLGHTHAHTNFLDMHKHMHTCAFCTHSQTHTYFLHTHTHMHTRTSPCTHREEALAQVGEGEGGRAQPP